MEEYKNKFITLKKRGAVLVVPDMIDAWFSWANRIEKNNLLGINLVEIVYKALKTLDNGDYCEDVYKILEESNLSNNAYVEAMRAISCYSDRGLEFFEWSSKNVQHPMYANITDVKEVVKILKENDKKRVKEEAKAGLN